MPYVKPTRNTSKIRLRAKSRRNVVILNEVRKGGHLMSARPKPNSNMESLYPSKNVQLRFNGCKYHLSCYAQSALQQSFLYLVISSLAFNTVLSYYRPSNESVYRRLFVLNILSENLKTYQPSLIFVVLNCSSQEESEAAHGTWEAWATGRTLHSTKALESILAPVKCTPCSPGLNDETQTANEPRGISPITVYVRLKLQGVCMFLTSSL